MSGNFYRAFEDRYRGSRELIKDRLGAYSAFTGPLAALYPGAPVLDLGCGRGEWLELMTEQGFDASGVHLDDGMLAACRERGLKVRTADALTSLRELPEASVAMVSAFHLVEHLPFEVAQTMIAESLRVLMPGGLLIMETPNPENLIVGTNNFYLDPSHVKPIPPVLLDFMVDHAGFPRHKIMRLARSDAEAGSTLGLKHVLQDVSADYGVVAQKQADDAAAAASGTAFAAAFDATYGETLDELAERFDQHIAEMRSGTAGLAQQSAQQTHILESLDKSNVELWNHALPGLQQGLAALNTRMEEIHAAAEAATQAAAAATQVAEAATQAAEARMLEVVARLEQRTSDRFRHSERRVGQVERRAAPLATRLERAEATATAAAARAQQAEAQAALLQQQVDAVLASNSWRITGPMRWLFGAPRRLVSATRQGRIKSGLRRRLSVWLAPVLGPAHPEVNTGLRGWIRRNKTRTWVRRLILPLWLRFPQMRGPFRRLAGITPATAPTGDLMLPDWPTPLPAEYLAMPVSTRKILLDLARLQQTQDSRSTPQ